MKKYYMIFLAVATAFMSCQKDPVQEPQTESGQTPQDESRPRPFWMVLT